MLFQVELALECVVDGLDDLPQGLEEPGPRPRRLALACRAQQLDPGLLHDLLKVLAVVVLVADQDLTAPVGFEPVHRRGAGQDVQKDLAFIRLHPGQCVADRQAVQGGNQVQAQPLVVPRLTRQIRKHAPVVFLGVAQAPGL